MKIKWQKLIISMAIPLLVGAVASFFTRDSMAKFEALAQPPLSPPSIAFPIVWTILYLLMGIASYNISQSSADENVKQNALAIYVISLVFNLFWPIIFFRLEMRLFAIIWILALFILVISYSAKYYRISRYDGIMSLPYILWLAYATYLNIAIYAINC